jgi:hypothetical protein
MGIDWFRSKLVVGITGTRKLLKNVRGEHEAAVPFTPD